MLNLIKYNRIIGHIDIQSINESIYCSLISLGYRLASPDNHSFNDVVRRKRKV